MRDLSKHRAMLIVNALNEQELRRRLDADPWMRAGVLRAIDIYPWEILQGQHRKQARIAARQTVQLKQFESNTSNNG